MVNKKGYEKPVIKTEKLFEETVLGCMKLTANSKCQPNKKES